MPREIKFIMPRELEQDDLFANPDEVSEALNGMKEWLKNHKDPDTVIASVKEGDFTPRMIVRLIEERVRSQKIGQDDHPVDDFFGAFIASMRITST